MICRGGYHRVVGQLGTPIFRDRFPNSLRTLVANALATNSSVVTNELSIPNPKSQDWVQQLVFWNLGLQETMFRREVNLPPLTDALSELTAMQDLTALEAGQEETNY